MKLQNQKKESCILNYQIEYLPDQRRMKEREEQKTTKPNIAQGKSSCSLGFYWEFQGRKREEEKIGELEKIGGRREKREMGMRERNEQLMAWGWGGFHINRFGILGRTRVP